MSAGLSLEKASLSKRWTHSLPILFAEERESDGVEVEVSYPLAVLQRRHDPVVKEGFSNREATTHPKKHVAAAVRFINHHHISGDLTGEFIFCSTSYGPGLKLKL